MHTTTLQKLGLSITANAAQISAALASPAAGRVTEAWNNEVQQRKTANGGNHQAAWESAQATDGALYASYERECAGRLRETVATESANTEAIVRGGTTANALKQFLTTANVSAMFTANSSNRSPLVEFALFHFVDRAINAEKDPNVVKALQAIKREMQAAS